LVPLPQVFREAALEDNVSSLDVSQFAQPCDECLPPGVGGRGLPDPKPADPVDLARLLRRGGEWRGEEAASYGAKEPASVHYSITWSARCKSDGGIVRPRALAVLRLITSSNFVACSTGRSPGFAPLRILST
jgi:hypothetical protein